MYRLAGAERLTALDLTGCHDPDDPAPFADGRSGPTNSLFLGGGAAAAAAAAAVVVVAVPFASASTLLQVDPPSPPAGRAQGRAGRTARKDGSTSQSKTVSFLVRPRGKAGKSFLAGFLVSQTLPSVLDQHRPPPPPVPLAARSSRWSGPQRAAGENDPHKPDQREMPCRPRVDRAASSLECPF